MKTSKTSPKYFEWLSADVMHEESKKWLSELRFIKDEEHFFEDLVKLFTLKLIDYKNYANTKALINSLKNLRNKNQELINTVIKHEKELQILLDGKDQLKEEADYKDKHRALLISVKHFFKDYRKLKREVFQIVKDIMKIEKRKKILA
jgi:hypothetical protein